jgi:tetratricopeptide (TPR) repeat protein
VLILGTVISFAVEAQYTKANDDPDTDFKLAKELYQKEQFSLAYPLFRTLYAENKTNSSIPVSIQSESKYYSYYLWACLKRRRLLKKLPWKYIALEHNEPRAQMMGYHLASIITTSKTLTDAANYYERAVYDNLSNAEIAQMKFHQGLCIFHMKRFIDAKPLFDAVRQISTDANYVDANYYYGFIAFQDKNYKEALNSFKVTESGPQIQRNCSVLYK